MKVTSASNYEDQMMLVPQVLLQNFGVGLFLAAIAVELALGKQSCFPHSDPATHGSAAGSHWALDRPPTPPPALSAGGKTVQNLGRIPRLDSRQFSTPKKPEFSSLAPVSLLPKTTLFPLRYQSPREIIPWVAAIVKVRYRNPRLAEPARVANPSSDQAARPSP